MTVCIAVRTNGSLVVISDRMLTAGDVQFEPPASKITMLTNSVGVMFAGDASFHHEIMLSLYNWVMARLDSHPNEWLKVKDVAEQYVNIRNASKSRRAESAILAPLGLDRATFLNAQNSMNPDLVQQISRDMINYAVPVTSAVVFGIDLQNTGVVPQIYSISNGQLSSQGAVAFVAVGSGAGHAELRLMLSGYAWNTPEHTALVQAYFAKKDSEIAPGVGVGTDVWIVGPQLGQSFKVGDEVVSGLDGEYKKMKQAQTKAETKANEAFAKYLKKRNEEAAAKQSQPVEQKESEESPDPARGSEPKA